MQGYVCSKGRMHQPYLLHKEGADCCQHKVLRPQIDDREEQGIKEQQGQLVIVEESPAEQGMVIWKQEKPLIALWPLHHARRPRAGRGKGQMLNPEEGAAAIGL